MKCTYCGNTKFYEGPNGGVSANILCNNPECRHWFNYNFASDKLEDLNRIEPSEEEKEQTTRKRKKEIKELPYKLYEEGRQAFKKGLKAIDIIESKPYWHSCNGEDFYRLAGYIDATME